MDAMVYKLYIGSIILWWLTSRTAIPETTDFYSWPGYSCTSPTAISQGETLSRLCKSVSLISDQLIVTVSTVSVSRSECGWEGKVGLPYLLHCVCVAAREVNLVLV